MEQYESIKGKCYLTIRKKRLCCIDLPYCPDGMVAEIPLKPYFMYPIHELKIGCRPKEKDDEETGSPKKPKIDIVCNADGKKNNLIFYVKWVFLIASILLFTVPLLICLFQKLRKKQLGQNSKFV